MADGEVRLRKAQRGQVEILTASLDDLLDPEHRVRLIWAYIQRLDMSAFHTDIKAVSGQPGRDATDPRILLCLWVVALSEGIGSARRLAALCERDIVFRWICGGVTMNRDLLANFRSSNGEKLDELMSQLVGALMHGGLVTLNVVAQDGMKVRASAGAASFRREPTLEECLAKAREQVAALKRELDADDSAMTRRDAARQRAADEKLAGIQRAMAEMPAVVAAKEAQKNKGRAKQSEPRASTTDAESRNMKMADGGFRPAYNPQFATDVDSGIIVGVHVTNEGTDARQAEPVIADIMKRFSRPPVQYLFDGGYVNNLNIISLTEAGIEVFAPPRQPRTEGGDPYEPQPKDTPEVVEWRKRMKSDEGKETYKQRASTAERINANLRVMGLKQVAVRGLAKVTSAVLLSVLAFNILRAVALLG
jgi:transposase